MSSSTSVSVSVGLMDAHPGWIIVSLVNRTAWCGISPSTARRLAKQLTLLADELDVQDCEEPDPDPDPTPGDNQDMALEVEQVETSPVRFTPDADGYENGN